MGLVTKINEDYLAAYKNGDSEKVSVLRLLKSQLKNLEIEQKAELSDGDVIRVIKREIKQREDSSLEFDKGGRPELAEKDRQEILVLKYYLPEQLSDDRIMAIAEAKIKELGIKDQSQKGRLIGAVMQETKGLADGSRVVEIVNRLLQ